jgi:AraC-like DNA-binding protein
MKINWNQTQVVLKSVNRVRCEPGWALQPSWSQKLPDFDLWFVNEGRGQMRMHQGTIELRPGVCFWMRPGGLYDGTQELSDPLTVSFAHFDLLDKQGRLRKFDSPLPPEVFTPTDVNLVDTIMRRLASTPLVNSPSSTNQAMRKSGAKSGDGSAGDEPLPVHDEVSQTLFRALLMELDADSDNTALSSRGTELHYRQIVQAIAMRITERPGQPHPISELAQEAGYSPDHFARIFKQTIGISPQAYVIRVRIDRAKQLLVESSLSISQIADVLGYEDLYFFSRQFKRKTGKTPRAYRSAGSVVD